MVVHIYPFLWIFVLAIIIWTVEGKPHTSAANKANLTSPWMALRSESEHTSLNKLRREHARHEGAGGRPRNYEEIYSSKVDGVEITENDIIVNRSTPFYTNLTERNFLINAQYHWPTTVIPVIIDPEAPYNRKERALITAAMAQYHLNTCMRFKLRTTEEDYIFITHDAARGCSSNVGRQGGRQVMYLRIPGCVTLIGTALHELLHNLGFFHEHSRPDRDQNINIIWKDITPGYENNFNAYSPTIIDTLGQPYDYDSVMQYSAVAFSKDATSYTIYPLHAEPKRLGQRLKFSDIDIRKVNIAYQCTGRERDRNEVDIAAGSAKIVNGDQQVSGIPVSPAVCYGSGPIDAAVMDSKGNLYVFKAGYFWIFNEGPTGKFTVKFLKTHVVTEHLSVFLPKKFDSVAFLDDQFYFFSNDTVYGLTSLDSNTVVDLVPMHKIFRPVDWNVKGFFELENQYFISNGSATFLYNPVNDAILSKMDFSTNSGLPVQYDSIFGVGNGRLMVVKGTDVYLTKPHLLTIEKGFPTTFQALFC